MVTACLEKAGASWRDLACLAATVGPGSFTGIRTCVAAARALALASGLGVIPVTMHGALAAAAGHGKPLRVIVGGRQWRRANPWW